MKVNFVTGCPISGCQNNRERIYWRHEGCNGSFKIDVYGDLECQKCNCKFNITNAWFNCGNDSIMFSRRSNLRRDNILMCLSSLNNDADEFFMKRLIGSVSKMCTEFDD